MTLDELIAVLLQHDPDKAVHRGLVLAKLRAPLPKHPHFILGGSDFVRDMLKDAKAARRVFDGDCKVLVGKGKHSLHDLTRAELDRLLGAGE